MSDAAQRVLVVDLERRMVETESRYQLAMLASNDAIWDWDLDDSQVAWSESLSTVFGYPDGEIGTTIEWRESKIHPEDRERVCEGLRQVLAGSGQFWQAEYRFARHDNTFAMVSDRAFVDRDATGKATRVVGALQDITERRRLLEVERRAREDAEAATRTRDTLMSIVSHDLRGPLGTIAIATALLRGELHATQGPHAQDKRLDAIERATDRMKSLITDLLDMAAIEAGRLVVNRNPEDVGALVRESVELVLPQATAKSITLDVEVAQGSHVAPCDRERVLQVLSNLFGNAIKLTPRRGKIVVRVRPAGDEEIVVEVTDTGPGIAAEHIAHLFDRFYRASKGEGVGLGLAIVKGIIDSHGGRIWVTSEVGHGSTFSFALPTKATAATTTTNPLSEDGSAP